jgi:hypothetical protein
MEDTLLVRQQGALRSVLLTKYYSGDQIREREIGRAYGVHGERRGDTGI